MSHEEQVNALRHEIAEAEGQAAEIEKTCAELLGRKRDIGSSINTSKARLKKLLSENQHPEPRFGACTTETRHTELMSTNKPTEWAATTGMARFKEHWGSREYLKTFYEPLISLDTVDASIARARIMALNIVLKEEDIYGGRVVPLYTPLGQQHTAYYLRTTH
jgi:chromosome segregation ATPase